MFGRICLCMNFMIWEKIPSRNANVLSWQSLLEWWFRQYRNCFAKCSTLEQIINIYDDIHSNDDNISRVEEPCQDYFYGFRCKGIQILVKLLLREKAAFFKLIQRILLLRLKLSINNMNHIKNRRGKNGWMLLKKNEVE